MTIEGPFEASTPMAFFQRVMHYVFNELLVNALANSRTFQRFAIRSNEAMQDFAKKSVFRCRPLFEQSAC